MAPNVRHKWATAVWAYDRDEILSAWRDDEPWFGLCADMREGVA